MVTQGLTQMRRSRSESQGERGLGYFNSMNRLRSQLDRCQEASDDLRPEQVR